MGNLFLWRVKVYDAESQSYTWLDKYAETAEQAEANVDPDDWVVVSGRTYKSEYQ